MNEYKKGYEDGYNAGKEDLKMLQDCIEQMKCCGNCKFHKYWGNELHCTHDGECIRFVNYAENRQDSWELED